MPALATCWLHFATCWPLFAGEIDREALGQIVFNDRMARRKLNNATHWPVLVEIVKRLLLHWLAFKWIAVRTHDRSVKRSHWG